jgi:Lon-like protease
MQRNEWDLPEPPDAQPVKGPKVWLWVGATIGTILLVAFALYVPIPIFYEFLPGPVSDVEKLVEIDGAETYSSDGKLYLTTVSVDTQVTLAKMIVALFSETQHVVLKDQVTGGATFEELEEQQNLEMKQSKQQARLVALEGLGLAEVNGDGARVAETVEGYPAHGVLRKDDVIKEIDGEPVATTCDAIKAIGDTQPGDELTIKVERGSETEEVTVETVENPQQPGSSFLGVAMEETGFELDTDIEIRFKTGEIAGPSAGLMFTLAVYDELTPDDLTGGRKIAGTGTISCGGEVGPIGGVEQKVAGAEAEGAEVFLAPEANYQAAKAAAGDIEVVSIADFDAAVDYLESTN